MKTLYVTDLDGTLMRDNKTISAESVKIFNRLIAQGVCLTYATARSINSSSRITKDIHFELPVIVLNGTILADPKTKKEIEIAKFSAEELGSIKHIVEKTDIPVLVTTYIDGKERKSYLPDRTNEGFRHYLISHAEDPRLHMVSHEDALYQGEICYFTFIAEKRELDPLYERVKDDTLNCVFQQDKYRPEYWLELCPPNATKANAIRRVSELCGCGKIVVFGDSLNDISMFQMADESYAVKNAMDELKNIATGILEDNNSDGVAKWLRLHTHVPQRK